MKSEGREFYWDFIRAVYLLMGIPFHVCVAYSTHFDWSVASPDRSMALTILADMLHTFRMPGFFVIAGYFSFMILSRKGPMIFLKTRLVRLGVPLLTATVTILPLQMAIQTYAEVLDGKLASGAFLSVFLARLTHFDEPWISHLWFLYILIGLTIGIALLALVFKTDPFDALCKNIAEFAYKHSSMSFIVVAFICTELAIILPGLESVGGSKLMALLSYVQYTPYFLIGGALHLSPVVKAGYLRVGPVAFLIGLLLAFNSILPASSAWTHVVFMVSGFYAALLVTGFVANLAQRYFNRPSPAIRNVADASFSIYLFHHPIIFLLAAFFARIDLPPVLEFAIITPITIGVSYLLHRLVAANPISAFLFNGVRSANIKPPVSRGGNGQGIGAAPGLS